MAKIDYGPTLATLRERGLVAADDVTIVCAEAPSASAMFWGGAIGAAISSSGRGHAVVALNGDRIRIFDIDKSTGQYLETMAEFDRENLKKVKFSTVLTHEILLKSTEGDAHFVVANKFNGFEQKDAVRDAFELLKNAYKKI